MQVVDTLIPTDSSGQVNQEEEACLASISTFSLPAVPQCPGTQMSRTLLKVANAFSAVITPGAKLVIA